MKKYTLPLLILFCVLSAHAQRTYLNEKGKKVDKPKLAVSYIIIKKLSDTSWLLQMYDMQDTIMSAGTFRDRTLKIPEGKFVYFYPFKHYKGKFIPPRGDTINHMRLFGGYKNGLKDSWWINYNLNGQRTLAQYYINGILNGPCLVYDQQLDKVKRDGQYKDGHMEGDWHTFDRFGQLIRTDKYQKDNLIESFKFTSKYTAALPTDEFYPFIEGTMHKLIGKNDVGRLIIICKIGTDGTLSAPRLISNSYDIRIEKKLFDAIPSSPPWIPAIRKDTHTAVSDMVWFTLDFSKGQAQANYLSSVQ